MRLLWLCNMQPGVIRTHITGTEQSAVNWVDHVLSGLRSRGEELRILCRGSGEQGTLEDGCSYATYRPRTSHEYSKEQEQFFRRQLREYAPEVIHIWGTEYGYALAMVHAAEAEGMLSRTVVSLQGLCSIYAQHYLEGIPDRVCRSATIRDLLRGDSIRQQQKKFTLVGAMERQVLEKIPYAIGRTDWDHACAVGIHPDIQYRFCNETLREEFYSGGWSYECCRKHRIFAPSHMYPIKGFHYMLEAFAQVLKRYPDATLAVTGSSILAGEGKDWLHIDGYERYLRQLARQYHLEEHLEFLGHLSAEEMKQAYLEANVFCLPSTIENSPNSLGEAMLLGVPCVAGDVGGVKNLLAHDQEGYVYQSTAPYMLSYYIQQVFAMEDRAAELGRRARAHASVTHDPARNLEQLLAIYGEIARCKDSK